MTDTKNLRAWVNAWGRELTWTDHNGAQAGSISKTEMLSLLDAAEKADKRVDGMFDLLETVRDANEDLRRQRDGLAVELEKVARTSAFEQAIDMLRCSATDPGAAKNYTSVELKWDRAIAPGLPFKRCAVVFFRDHAKGPATLVGEALEARDKLSGIARASSRTSSSSPDLGATRSSPRSKRSPRSPIRIASRARTCSSKEIQ